MKFILETQKEELKVHMYLKTDATGVILMANDNHILKINNDGTLSRYLLGVPAERIGFKIDKYSRIELDD